MCSSLSFGTIRIPDADFVSLWYNATKWLHDMLFPFFHILRHLEFLQFLTVFIKYGGSAKKYKLLLSCAKGLTTLCKTPSFGLCTLISRRFTLHPSKVAESTCNFTKWRLTSYARINATFNPQVSILWTASQNGSYSMSPAISAHANCAWGNWRLVNSPRTMNTITVLANLLDPDDGWLLSSLTSTWLSNFARCVTMSLMLTYPPSYCTRMFIEDQLFLNVHFIK